MSSWWFRVSCFSCLLFLGDADVVLFEFSSTGQGFAAGVLDAALLMDQSFIGLATADKDAVEVVTAPDGDLLSVCKGEEQLIAALCSFLGDSDSSEDSFQQWCFFANAD